MPVRYDRDLFALTLPKDQFDPRRLNGFESMRLAKTRRDRLSSALYEGRGDAVLLAQTLDSCHRDKRCCSPACPVCCRMIRIRYCSVVARRIGTDSERWSAVSVVGERDQFRTDRLHQYLPHKMKERLRQQLARSNLNQAPVFGGIDFDLDLVGGPARYCAHWYLLVRASPDACREALEKYYPVTDRVPRPVVAKWINPGEELGPATYMVKPIYKERRRIRDFRGNRSTVHQPLSSHNLQQLMPVIHRWGTVSRLFQKYV